MFNIRKVNSAIKDFAADKKISTSNKVTKTLSQNHLKHATTSDRIVERLTLPSPSFLPLAEGRRRLMYIITSVP